MVVFELLDLLKWEEKTKIKNVDNGLLFFSFYDYHYHYSSYYYCRYCYSFCPWHKSTLLFIILNSPLPLPLPHRCLNILKAYGRRLGLDQEAGGKWDGEGKLEHHHHHHQHHQQQHQEGEGWFGFRPCPPDGIPLVGKDERYSNVYWNVGHGAMGFRVAAETADHLGRVMGGGRGREGYERFLDPMRFSFWRW